MSDEEEALVAKLKEIVGDTDLAGATIRIDVGAGEVLVGQATDTQIVALYEVLSELGLAPLHIGTARVMVEKLLGRWGVMEVLGSSSARGASSGKSSNSQDRGEQG